MSFFQNTCKPKGFGGKLMVTTMNWGHTPLAKWGFSHIAPNEDAMALDIGCGGGKNISKLLKCCPKGKVDGIDYSEVSVEKSRSYNRGAIQDGRCEVRQGDVMQLPYAEESFDLVTAFETVYFWPDLREAFAQVRKVLKKGGTFLITNECIAGDTSAEKWTEVIEGMHLYSAKELAKLLAEAGFVDITSDSSPKGWICLTARK